MAPDDGTAPLTFTGHHNLAQRLVLATLTGRALKVSQIRPSSHTHPGLAPHEVSLLRLLDSITNGSHIEFSYTGTALLYKPGLIAGGRITHKLPAENTRGLSYYLMPLCMLAPFAKNKLEVAFSGPGCITSATHTGDVSVDTVRTAVLPVYTHFGVTVDLELRVQRRSCAGPEGKGGAGEVTLRLGHQVRLPKTLHLMNAGKVKRIRGVAYATGVAGANNARMIEAARGVLNKFVPDTYIYSDMSAAPFVAQEEQGQARPKGSGATPKKKMGIGFGLSLVAESSTYCLYSADVVSSPEGGEAAEDLGLRCAYQLLEVISLGGCTSPLMAPSMLTLMAMGSEDAGRLQLGKDVVGSEQMVELARDLRAFGASGWGLRDAEDAKDEVIVTVVGRGVGNVARKIA